MAEVPPFPCPTKRWHSKEQPSTSPTRPRVFVKGKSVVITGGGNTGLGGETARKSAEAGASRIALLGRREKPLLDNKAWVESNFPSADVTTISADMTSQDDMAAAFANIGAGRWENRRLDPLRSHHRVKEARHDRQRQCVPRGHPDQRDRLPVVVAINSFGAHLTIGNIFDSYCVAKITVIRLWDEVGHANPGMAIFHIQPGVIITEMKLRDGGAVSLEDIKADDGTCKSEATLYPS
ncbi:hypothetical protein SLS62_006231 [Diatrype stigma]|uniref:Ketoreductase (KR) domain-containing protein n=1 Tax=Diatrype stigma TaxID=117547 RepID=A0AAN9YP64_9PEZI